MQHAERDTDRRTFVRMAGTAAAVGTLALAGCFGTGDDGVNENESNGTDEDDETGEDENGVPRFPDIEAPPDAVYLPTHRESMRVLEPIEAGEYTLAPMLSYPHPFWTVAGGDGGSDGVEKVPVEDMAGVHAMFTLWDDETGVVLPVGTDASIRVSRDGERVGSPRSPWPMISQGMGFHFGDNVPLEGDGTYRIEVDLPPLSARTTGALADRFTERETATFEFAFDQAFREDVFDVDYFDEDEWGDPGALEPMDHDHVPYSQLPDVGEYPGTLLVEPDGDPADETEALPRSGDAAILATLFDPGSRFADGDDRYLLVSPRTPYNRVPLANVALTATVERDGETVAESSLSQTIDGEFDHHYGASLADVRPGDTVTITIDRPPQVARHRGYETAFLEMPAVELAVPEEQ